MRNSYISLCKKLWITARLCRESRVQALAGSALNRGVRWRSVAFCGMGQRARVRSPARGQRPCVTRTRVEIGCNRSTTEAPENLAIAGFCMGTTPITQPQRRAYWCAARGTHPEGYPYRGACMHPGVRFGRGTPGVRVGAKLDVPAPVSDNPRE